MYGAKDSLKGASPKMGSFEPRAAMNEHHSWCSEFDTVGLDIDAHPTAASLRPNAA